MLNKTCLAIAAAMAALFSPALNATIVQFQSPFINLYDQSTPATAANFLAYVNAGAYDIVVVHRVVGGFVVQGGGFTYERNSTFADVVRNTPVVNEPKFSNVRGTIAMAKLSGDANSATNQWFINLGDNSANLDVQNGGFAVFGQVIGNGMDVLNAINALPRFNFSSPFEAILLRDYTARMQLTTWRLPIGISFSSQPSWCWMGLWIQPQASRPPPTRSSIKRRRHRQRPTVRWWRWRSYGPRVTASARSVEHPSTTQRGARTGLNRAPLQ